MTCRYCGYDVGHASGCPAFQGDSVRYSGREFEFDCFGQVDIRDPRYKADLAKVSKPDGYVTFRDAVDLVKKHQPADPTNPGKDYFRELVMVVQEKMGVDTSREPDRVKGYTAVKTPLDERHKVDAFVTFGYKGRELMVTLDASKRPEKIEEGSKADFVVPPWPTPEDDEDAYLKAVGAMAGQIADNLKNQIAAAEHHGR